MANSVNTTSGAGGLAIDANSLNSLRTMSKDQNSDEALKGAAKQFEAIFLNMVMKSMREATPSESPFDSEQSKMFLSMLDQEMTQKLAERGIGLAEVLVRQLSQNKGVTPEALQQSGQGAPLHDKEQGAPLNNTLKPVDIEKYYYEQGVSKVRRSVEGAAQTGSQEKRERPAHVEAFVEKFGDAAAAASKDTGIPVNFILAHAALESGWGKKEMTAANGVNSHNVFGIKAGGQWSGKVINSVTTEYVDGKPRQQTETFRAYDSYTDAFKDYAHFLAGNKRYQEVIANAKDAGGFANGLQRAGYATDPLYAQKLTKIIKESLPA